MVLEESRVWFLGECLALYPSTKKRHVGTRRSRKHNLFPENSSTSQLLSNMTVNDDLRASETGDGESNRSPRLWDPPWGNVSPGRHQASN